IHASGATDHASSSNFPAPPDFVLLLNADAEVNGDAVWQMACFLKKTPGAGACGAHLHYGNGAFQHGAFAFPSLAQLTIDFFPLTALPGVQRLHNSRLNGRYSQSLWGGTAPFPVDFVLGAALMVRGEVIQQLGGLDDGYFLYCEELDWAVRMKLAGWQSYAVPTAHVTHHEGQSSKQVRWSAFVRLWRSRLRFYRKYRGLHPVGYESAVRLIVLVGLLWRLRQVNRQFAQGKHNGLVWQEERRAYQEVLGLLIRGD
ncbi:MAG: glycosyltransferase family 2 protein, partial [Caldilineaceae bacterium]